MFTAAAVIGCALLIVAIGLHLRRHARDDSRINVGSVSEQWLMTHRMEDS
ncbi:MAG: hypothetical protein ACM3SQ_07950 [Betaproteobacteria bacterium]